MESAVAAREERGADSHETRLTCDCSWPGAGTGDVTVADGEVTSADAVDEELSWEVLAFTAMDDPTSLAVPGHLPSTLTRRR